MVSQITCRKMSNIYLTLVSDVTKKYTSNVANQFKVKPQLRLPGEGWKVSVAGAILPKIPLFKELQSANVNLIELWGETEKQDGTLVQFQSDSQCVIRLHFKKE